MIGIITKLRITVDVGQRNIHVSHGGWRVMTRSGWNRLVCPLAPTARGYTKLEEYFAKMGNSDLDVLSTRADFSDISDAIRVPTRKKKGM